MESQQILKAILNVKQHQFKLKQSMAKSNQSISRSQLSASEFSSAKTINQKVKTSLEQEMKYFPSFGEVYHEEVRPKSRMDYKEASLLKSKSTLKHAQSFQPSKAVKDRHYTSDKTNSQIQVLKLEVQRLAGEKQQLINDLNQYKMALVLMKNRIRKIETQSLKMDYFQSQIRELKKKVQEERDKSSLILTTLRQEQQKLRIIQQSLLEYYRRATIPTGDDKHIWNLEAQNHHLRNVLKLAHSEVDFTQVDGLNTQFQGIPAIQKMSIRKSQITSVKEYIVDKLKQIAECNRGQKKKVEELLITVPINNMSSERDMVEDAMTKL